MKPNDLYLSHWDSQDEVVLSENTIPTLKPFHYMPIRFLYSCFKKDYGGAILNQDENMNFPVQISAFLHVLMTYFNATLTNPILVLSFDSYLKFWHYHLINDGKFAVTMDLNNHDSSKILLASLSDIKLLQCLKERNFSVVIVDEFDKVATRLLFRKLKGKFNIGLTYRNFVGNPDQKLQWSMLRWSNPNIVGKFAAFCQTDDEHFVNFCEPFTDIWQRLTWNFYIDFPRETAEERQQYIERINKWAAEHHIASNDNTNISRQKRKAKDEKQSKSANVVEKSIIDAQNSSNRVLDDSSSSQDTIIYEPTDIVKKYIELPSMDESPMLNSIIKNFSQEQDKASCSQEIEADIKSTTDDSVLSFLFAGPSCSSTKDPDDAYPMLEETCSSPENYEKSDLLAELFGE